MLFCVYQFDSLVRLPDELIFNEENGFFFPFFWNDDNKIQIAFITSAENKKKSSKELVSIPHSCLIHFYTFYSFRYICIFSNSDMYFGSALVMRFHAIKRIDFHWNVLFFYSLAAARICCHCHWAVIYTWQRGYLIRLLRHL